MTESRCGPQSLNNSLSDPLQKKKFADPLWGSKENISVFLHFEDFESKFYADLRTELKASVGQ